MLYYQLWSHPDHKHLPVAVLPRFMFIYYATYLLPIFGSVYNGTYPLPSSISMYNGTYLLPTFTFIIIICCPISILYTTAFFFMVLNTIWTRAQPQNTSVSFVVVWSSWYSQHLPVSKSSPSHLFVDTLLYWAPKLPCTRTRAAHTCIAELSVC